MTSLTTRQRDLLNLLLETESTMSSAEIARAMQLTPRQVNYSLKGVKSWLWQREVRLQVSPGVGVELGCSPQKRESLLNELNNTSNYQLVLSAEQRQELLALHLLVSDTPFILFQLQQLAQVSRSTILKDLDGLLPWLNQFALSLERRPNYGIWVEGAEGNRRKALAILMWGAEPFDPPLFKMTLTKGLVFTLLNDEHLLPILTKTVEVLGGIDTKKSLGLVADAEAQLGGRFTDNAVLHIALVLALQTARIKTENFLESTDEGGNSWLQTHPVWPVALKMLNRIGRPAENKDQLAEATSIALLLLASAKNERWPGDLENDTDFAPLIKKLMKRIASAYEMPGLENDSTLRDGLIANLVPACLRLSYGIWTPNIPKQHQLSAEKYAFENQLAQDLGQVIKNETELSLPPRDLENLTMLLRAAYIRERPHNQRNVIVVCPSGMATAQLLVARLKARFPNLGTVTVLSVRELDSARLAETDLIITTVPLAYKDVSVLMVHPLLLPEDISRITQWLA